MGGEEKEIHVNDFAWAEERKKCFWTEMLRVMKFSSVHGGAGGGEANL